MILNINGAWKVNNIKGETVSSCALNDPWRACSFLGVQRMMINIQTQRANNCHICQNNLLLLPENLSPYSEHTVMNIENNQEFMGIDLFTLLQITLMTKRLRGGKA